MRVHSLLVLSFVAVALICLNACAPNPTPTVPSSPTALKIATSVPATRVPTQNAPASPTGAAQSTLPTPVAAPTDTPQPTDTAEASPTQVPPTQAPPAVVGVPSDYFGVNTDGEIYNAAEVRALATVAGVQMVRTSVYWSSVEKKQGTFSWNSFDGTIKTLTENNFAPLVLIMNNPDWAANSPCGPVNDLAAFDSFMHTLVARYPQVKYWALYNEPDNSNYPKVSPGGCFGGADVNGNGKPDVEDYAEMLRVAWHAMHQANPNALLVTGALAFDSFDPASAPPGYPGGGAGGNFDFNFPAKLFQYIHAHPLANGEKYFDVLSFNFYMIYGPYWEQQVGGVGLSAKANMLNKIMSDNGESFPLLVSETGDDSTRIGTDGQSKYLMQTYTRGLASGITAVVWWTFQDYPDSSPPPSNTWKYGLITQENKTKPAYAAFQTISHLLTGAQYTGPLQVSGAEGYVFAKDSGGLAIVWSTSDTPVTVTFSATKLQVMDMYGAKKEVDDGAPQDNDPAAGRIGVGVDQNPLYIQVIAQ